MSMIRTLGRPAFLAVAAAVIALLGAGALPGGATAATSDVAVETHAARLGPLDAVCSRVDPVGRAVSRQLARPEDGGHGRAVLEVQVRGLVCPRVQAVVVIVVRASGEHIRIGEMRIHDGGWGVARFATGAGYPVPRIEAGDGIILVGGDARLMGGRFVLVR